MPEPGIAIPIKPATMTWAVVYTPKMVCAVDIWIPSERLLAYSEKELHATIVHVLTFCQVGRAVKIAIETSVQGLRITITFLPEGMVEASLATHRLCATVSSIHEGRMAIRLIYVGRRRED